MSDERRRAWAGRILLGALFVVALLPRVYALGWGLPYVEHPDEPALMQVVVRMVRDGDLNPRSFLYPSLSFYLLAAATRLHAWWGINHGLYTSLQDLPLKTSLFTTSPDLYRWNRAVTALLGAATVPALYLLGRHMFDRRTGLLGAVLLAVAVFHVEHSHYITTDAPTGLWVVLALLGAWQVTTTGGWRGYALAGATAGLAAGTKYQAGVVALALVAAHVLFWRGASYRRPLRLAMGAALALLVFLATTPYALLDWRGFIAALHFNAEHYANGGHGDFVGRWQFWGYAEFLWSRGLFASGIALTLLGLPILARRFPRQLALLLVVVLVELALLLAQSVNFVRNLLPIFPLLLLLAAAGAVALADLVRPAALRRAALVLLAVALLWPQARETFWLLRYWGRPYTMAAAAATLRELPRGMRAAVEMNPVEWANDPVVFPVEHLTDHTLDWYRANGFRYLVANSDDRSEADRPAYEQLQAAARVIAEYPERRAGIQPGPGGAILDLGEHMETMTFVSRELRFGDGVMLLGYEVQPGAPRSRITPLDGAGVRTVDSGQPLQINLYWRALALLDRDYTLFVHVVDQAGAIVAQRDLPLRYSDYPTSHWRPGELVIDLADSALPPLPPGEYRLDIGLYDPTTTLRLPIQLPGGGTEASATLTTLTIH